MIRGHILLWSKPIAQIPTGWHLCDGTNGTPDLRDKFVVGAGNTYAVSAVGGAVNHNHAFTGNGHSHAIASGIEIQAGSGFHQVTASTPATGTTDNANHLPPYHALAYIMKL